jgi:hypothetical protein
MTDTVPAGGEIVSERRSSRRRTLRWTIVGVLIAALVAIPSWWFVATDTSHLEQGSFSSGDAWRIRAGDTDVYCFGIAPGDSIPLGFSLRNTSPHTITITRISLAMGSAIGQTITVSRVDRRGIQGPELPFAPVTLPPQYEAYFSVHLQVPTDMSMMGESYMFTDMAVTDYRVLGRKLHRFVPLGLWFEFNHTETGKLPCQPMPPTGT